MGRNPIQQKITPCGISGETKKFAKAGFYAAMSAFVDAPLKMDVAKLQPITYDPMNHHEWIRPSSNRSTASSSASSAGYPTPTME